jgi:dTDP-4-dehydrorhamnose reductase
VSSGDHIRCCRGNLEIRKDLGNLRQMLRKEAFRREHAEEGFCSHSGGDQDTPQTVQKFGSFFCHYSSDYLERYRERQPLQVNDGTNPLNQYGKSRLEEKKMVQNVFAEALNFRLSWVIGAGRQNFISNLSNGLRKRLQ